METYHSDLINEEEFWNWLKPRATPKQLSEFFRFAYALREQFAPEDGIPALIDEMFRTSPAHVKSKILQDKNFQKRLSDYDKQFIFMLLIYMENFVNANAAKWKSEKQAKVSTAPVTSRAHPAKEPGSVSAAVKTLDFANLSDVRFTQPVSINCYGTNLQVSSWRSLYVIACKMLLLRHPSVFARLQEESLLGDNGLHIVDPSHIYLLTKAESLNPRFFIEVQRSANDLMRNLKTIIDRCGEDYKNFIITYTLPETSEKEQPEPVIKQREDNTRKEQPEPVVKQSEDNARKEQPEPVVKQSENNIQKEQPEPVFKQSEDNTQKEQPEPVVKQSEDTPRKEQPEPVIKHQEDNTRKEQTDPNEDIRLALLKLSAETEEGISAKMISKEIGNRLESYKVRPILNNVKWAKKIAFNSYRYFDPEAQTNSAAESSNDKIEAAEIPEMAVHQEKTQPDTEEVKVSDNTAFSTKPQETEENDFPTDQTQIVQKETLIDAEETVRAALEKLYKKNKSGVSVMAVLKTVGKNFTKDQVSDILSNAEWAEETNWGYIYAAQNQDDSKDTDKTDNPLPVPGVTDDGIINKPKDIVSPQMTNQKDLENIVQSALEKLSKNFPGGVSVLQILEKIVNNYSKDQISDLLSHADWAKQVKWGFIYDISVDENTKDSSDENADDKDAKILEQIRILLQNIRDTKPSGLSASAISSQIDGKRTPNEIKQMLSDVEWVEESAGSYKYAEPITENNKPKADPDSPAAQPRWNEYEAAILLDAYLKVCEEPGKRKELVQQVSDQLRQMAINQGMQISDTYRNYAGINIKMYGMETAWKGMESFGHIMASKVFSKIVDLYKKDKTSFDHLLWKAQELSKKVQTDSHQIIITKIDFRKYLKDKGHSPFQQASLGVTLSTLERIFDSKIFDQPVEDCFKAVAFLQQKLTDPIYKTAEREKAIKIFSEFLSEQGTTVKPSEEITNQNKVPDPDTGKDDEWILAQLQANNIRYLDNRMKKGCLWILGGHELEVFLQKCYSHGYRFYFKPDGCKAFPNTKVWWTTDKFSSPPVPPSSISEEPEPYLPDNKQQYREILIEQFRNGYIPGIMDRKRFKKSWQKKYHTEVPANDKELEKIIRDICIEGEGRYYIPEAMMNDEQQKQVMAYLKKRTEAGDKAVSYQVTFEDLSDLLVHTEISTPDMLHSWLQHAAKGQYRFDKNYVILQVGGHFDPEREIRDYLMEARVPVDYDQICTNLSHIPADKIKNSLNAIPSILYNASNQWFEAEILDLTAEDFRKIRSLIDKNLDAQDFVLVRELYEDLVSVHSDVSDQLSVLSMYGLQNYLKFKLSHIYVFNGQIISSHSRAIDTAAIYRNFAKRNVPFTYEDLRDLSKDLNTIINYESIFTNCIRVNEKDFVSKESVYFDIKGTDDVLEHFFTGAYMPLKEIHSFDLLPGCGSPWNIFLLEQYVYQFSKKFRLCHAGFSADTCAGAIVPKFSQINDFKNDLVPTALADTNFALTKKNILDYLSASGLIARKNLEITEGMLQRAKTLRSQKGKN